MTIEYGRLRSLTARQLTAALTTDGFALRRQRGSHRRYAHPDGRRVTLSFHHASDTFRSFVGSVSSETNRTTNPRTPPGTTRTRQLSSDVENTRAALLECGRNRGHH